MAISVTAPEAISFSRDRIVYTFTRDNEGYSDGVKAVNFMSIASAIGDGTLITIRWNNQELQLIARVTPGTKGDEFPAGASTSGYATQLAAWFQNNYFINEDFVVTSGTKLGAPAVIFTARNAGAAYSFQPTTFPGGVFQNETEGENQDKQVNHSVFLDVFMENEAGTFASIHKATIPFDKNRDATIDIAEILHPHLSPEIPSFTLPTALRCTNSRRRFYLRYASASGEKFSTGQLATTAERVVILGSFSEFLGGPVSVTGTFKKATQAEDRFLTIKNATRYVRRNEPLFVSWVNLRTLKNNIYGKVTVYFTDDSDPTVTNTANISAVALYQKLLFGIGFEQLGLSFFSGVKVVKQYTLQLWDDVNPVSEMITCILDVSYRPYTRYFAYVNSYGSVETIKTYGKESAEYKLFSERAEQVMPYTFTPSRAQYVEYDRSHESNYLVTSGMLLKHEFGYFLELFNSPTKFKITQGKPRAINLNTDKISQGKDGDNIFALAFEYSLSLRQDAISELELELLANGDISNLVPPGVQPAGNITIGYPSTPWTGIIDPYPITGSDNPVSSSGVFARLELKLNAANLRQSIKEIDGEGSEIDTDLWRGFTPAQITVGKATLLSNARKIALAGAMTGEINFDGGSDQTITARIANEVNFDDGEVPSGVKMEVGGTTPVVNLHANFRGDFDDSNIGGAMRVDTRGSGTAPLFQWLYRDLAGDEHTVASLSQEGNFRYDGWLSPDGQVGTFGQVLKNGSDGNIWGNITFAELTSKPTTSDGFGITNVVKQGGNAFGAMLRIRTLDNQPLALGSNGVDYFYVNTSGQFVSNDAVSSTPKVDIKGADIVVNGIRVGRGATNKDSNLIIGNGIGWDLISAERNVFIGTEAAFSATRQSDSVYIGYQAGYQAMGDEMGIGWRGTYIGALAGSEAFISLGSIAIGYNAQLLNPNQNDQLSIGNWIYGRNGYISIAGAPDLARRLKVYGKGEFTDQLVLSVANGTAPILVTSTTEVANLNSARLQSYAAAAFPRKAEAATITEQWNFGALPVSSVTPTLPNHLTTKGYVDSQSFVKRGDSVMAVLTVNTTLHGTFEVAGYMLVNGDRVLVTAQTDPKANGIYIADGGGWIRATNADTDTELRGYYHLVLESDLAGQRWINTNTSTITIGSTNITYGLDFGQETDPTVPTWVKDIIEADITNWGTAFDRSLEVTYGHLWKEVDGNETQLSLLQVNAVAATFTKPDVDIYGRVIGGNVLQISDVNQLQMYLDSRVALVDRYVNDVRVWDNNSTLISSFPINDDWATITGKPDWTINDSRHPRFSGMPIIRFIEGEEFDETIDLSLYKVSYHSLENLFIVMIINLGKADGLIVTREGKTLRLTGTIDRVIDPSEDILAVVVEDNYGNQSFVKILFAVDVAPPPPACGVPLTFYRAEGNATYEITGTSMRIRVDVAGAEEVKCTVKTAEGVAIPGQVTVINLQTQLHPLPPYTAGTNRPLVTFASPLSPGNYQLTIESLTCTSPTDTIGFTVPGTTPPPVTTARLRLISSNASGSTYTNIANLGGASGTFLVPEIWNIVFNNIGGAAYDYVHIIVEELIGGVYIRTYTNSDMSPNDGDHTVTSSVTAMDMRVFESDSPTRYTIPNGTQSIYRNASYRVKAQPRIGGKTGTIVGYEEATFSVTTNPPILKTQWATYQKVAGSYVDMTTDEYMDGLVRKRNIGGVAHTIFYYLDDFPHMNPDGTPKPFASGDYPLMSGETIGIRKLYARSSWVSTFAQLRSKMGDVWTTPDLIKAVANLNLSLY